MVGRRKEAPAGACVEHGGEEPALEDAMQEDGEPEEGTPEPPMAVPVGGGPAQRASAGKPGAGRQRKSKFAHVTWKTGAALSTRGWYGQLGATSKHPHFKTPYYLTDEDAARAVDR